MEILPKNLGTRPRLAIEIRSEGIVAARAEDAMGVLTAIAERPLPEGAFTASLHAGSFRADELVSVVRESLDAIAQRGERTRDVTLVVPDAATRVLLLEFDELPGKATEVLPVVRFRLKKLVPFDPDHAMVSYQTMPSEGRIVRLLVVAMPSEVLAEYEGLIAAAGYITGAILPSTLAALASLDEQEAPVLMMNASHTAVTTAIVRGGTLLLHRTIELELESREEDVLAPPYRTVHEVDHMESEVDMESHVLEAVLQDGSNAREIAQAVSVAAAYFEDTLASSPQEVLSAGPLSAASLRSLLHRYGIESVGVREAIGPDAFAAAPGSVLTRGWFAGVRGALRN